MPTSSQSSMPLLCLPASFFASKQQQQQQHAPSLPWPAERKPPCGFYYTTLILHFSMHFVFCCSIIYYYTLVLTLFPLVRFLFFFRIFATWTKKMTSCARGGKGATDGARSLRPTSLIWPTCHSLTSVGEILMMQWGKF